MDHAGHHGHDDLAEISDERHDAALMSIEGFDDAGGPPPETAEPESGDSREPSAEAAPAEPAAPPGPPQEAAAAMSESKQIYGTLVSMQSSQHQANMTTIGNMRA